MARPNAATHSQHGTTAESELRALLDTYGAKLEASDRRVEELEAMLAANERAAMEASDCHRVVDRAQQEAIQRRQRESDTLRKALEEIEVAQTATADATLIQARQHLDSPDARSAAQALIAVTAATMDCRPEALAEVRSAERGVRDVVVMRIHASATPESKEAFEVLASEAFGEHWDPLDRTLWSQLHHAYRKWAKKHNVNTLFESGNQIQTARRGHPRPRRVRREEAAALAAARGEQAAELAAAELAAATARSSSRQRTEPWQADPAFVFDEDLVAVRSVSRARDAPAFPEIHVHRI